MIAALRSAEFPNKIAAGKKIALRANISPANATNKTLVWTSSNPKVPPKCKWYCHNEKRQRRKKVKINAKAADGSGKKAVYTITSMKGVVKKSYDFRKKSVKAGKRIKRKRESKAKEGNTRLLLESSNQKFATVKNGKSKRQRKNAKEKK